MDEQLAIRIAQYWGVDPELLLESEWELETIDGNDGELYGYRVVFDKDTDQNVLLEQLGIRHGQFERDVSIAAVESSDSDPERGRLDLDQRLAKIEEMVEWFHQHFEDPAERTPYESSEGGYQWIWGGPHDAREELEAEFGDDVDFEIIEEAVAEIERDGVVDWAPAESPDDYDVPEMGEPADTEARLKQEIERNLAVLDEAVDALKALALRSHNQPPELVEETGVDPEIVQEVEDATRIVREELAASTPDIPKVEHQLTIFQRIANFLAENKKEIMIGVGVNVVSNPQGVVEGLWSAVMLVAHSVGQWVSYLNLPV
ncbi:MAG: hypothetical protein K0M60_13335 [Hydrogenophaga sp.]|nr:hypothetical protein [Hydrogenophaga sp.]